MGSTPGLSLYGLLAVVDALTGERVPRGVSPVYGSWEQAQRAGLRTQTQWRTDRRRVLADAAPRGVVIGQSGQQWYWLYAKEQTKPMRTVTPTQRAALE